MDEKFQFNGTRSDIQQAIIQSVLNILYRTVRD